MASSQAPRPANDATFERYGNRGSLFDRSASFLMDRRSALRDHLGSGQFGANDTLVIRLEVYILNGLLGDDVDLLAQVAAQVAAAYIRPYEQWLALVPVEEFDQPFNDIQPAFANAWRAIEMLFEDNPPLEHDVLPR